MQWKKIMSGVLAGTLVLTSVAPTMAAVEEIPVLEAEEITGVDSETDTGNIVVEESAEDAQTLSEDELVAEEQVAISEDGLAAAYDFDEDTLVNTVDEADSASAVVKGLDEYKGDIVFADGRTEGSRAIQLGDYGLKLNKENFGNNFTVSLWLKPTQKLVENQNVLFLGYHNKEKWLGVAGTGNDAWKVWANGNGYSWNTFFSPTLSVNDWHCLTITGNEESVSTYVDGEKLGTVTSNNPLEGDNQDIYIGVTYWDPAFSGLVDDIKVYNRELTEGEVYQLYDDSSVESVLEKEGISATDSLKIVKGKAKTIEVAMPAVVKEANPEVTYRSSDDSVATVDNEGTVTGVAAGKAQITTLVKIGGTTKTATTSITVTDSLDEYLVASYTFEDTLSDENGKNTADAIVTGLGAYNGNVQYKDGHSGKAVQLGDYGLKLNKENFGTDYTVSVWLKPDGILAANQSVLFMGYHNPEKWFGVAGEDDTNKCKIWTREDGGNLYSSWTTLFSPTISSDRWHNLTFTGTKGKVTSYLDGVKLGTKDSIDPLVGENQDIYLGVNYWDGEFTGLMDDVKIYSEALTEEDVQNLNKTEFQEILKDKLDKAVTLNSILGKNDSADNIKYDLNLPSDLEGMAISWNSSSACISENGVVGNVENDTTVTLEATVTSGTLTATATYDLTVKALDKTELNTLIQKAEALDTTYYTQVSITHLQNAINEAKAADSFTKIDEATLKLSKAIKELSYVPEYVNPFDSITAPDTRKNMKTGEETLLFRIPDTIKDMVTVEYKSSDESMAVYENGTVSAKKEGKVSVTAIVIAKYNNWKMEYSTALDIAKDSHTPVDPTVTPTPTEPSVVLTPSAENKEDGKVEVKVPDVSKETKEVTVELPGKSLAETVKNNASSEVDVTVQLPNSIAGSSDVSLKGINLPKEVLQALKVSGKELTVNVSDESGNSYSWSIAGKDVDKVRLSDVNLVLSIQNAEQDKDVKDKLFQDESGLSVDLMQKEGLPGIFSITVDGSKYGIAEGDKMKLREYDAVKDTMDTLSQSCTAGKDGKVTFTVSSGMKFILTKTTPISVGSITGTKTAATSSAIKLTWDKVEGADGYRVYRYNSASKKYEKLSDVKSNTYTDKGRKSATAAVYKVRAYVKASKNYFGTPTAAIKVMSDPLVPSNVKGKRTTKAGLKTSATISFKKSTRANEYRIYKYNAKKNKYTIAYRVKNNKLYQYNSKTKKYTKVNNVVDKKGTITCTLKNLNLKKEKVQKFKVRSVVTKSGYATGVSGMSNVVTIK